LSYELQELSNVVQVSWRMITYSWWY